MVSDPFAGFLVGIATSSLSAMGLAGGAYTLVITGNIISTGNYDLKLGVTPLLAAALLLGPALAGLGVAVRRRRGV